MQDMLGQRPASQGHDHRQASGDFGGQQTRAHQAADKEVCGEEIEEGQAMQSIQRKVETEEVL